ncbi:MAG: BolA family transcriptional regulator [Thalassobaculaceae bacterium]|nr:BolA family transcriptional regulator [Thalassobaculaceae bacterium]
MTIADTLRKKLDSAFEPAALEVVDESHLHAGHIGARPEGETHFRVTLVSSAFSGLGRVQRHRLVHEVLAAELRDHVHALALVLRAPEEQR